MANDSLIPSVTLDAALVGERHFFDAWREAVRGYYDVNPLSDRRSGQERVAAWLLSNLIFTEVAFSAQSFSHHSAHTEDARYLSLQIYYGGSCQGVADDMPFVMAPGYVHVFDFSREFHSVADASVVGGVCIPHEAVGYDPGRHPAHMIFAGHSAVGRLLMSAFFALKSRLASVKQGEANTLAEGFCAFLNGLVFCEEGQKTEPRSLDAERRLEIRSFLEKHLADHDLGVERLSREFGASRSSIYREFAETGGVVHYITRRRLDRIFDQLHASPPSRGRVQEIANRWGFEDPGYFSRLFRRQFGVSPSKVMGIGYRPTSSGRLRSGIRDGQALSGWLRTI